MYWRIGSPPIPVDTHYHSRSCHLILQAKNREVLEIVRSEEDVLSAHHRVSGMNFIPGGYTVPNAIREACAEAKSQLIVNASVETDTQPPSLVADIDPTVDDNDEDEPSTPREDVIPNPPAIPAPQLQTPSASRRTNLYRRKSKSLLVNIREPPREELVRRMVEAFNAALPSCPGCSPPQRRISLSLSAPTQEDLP